jgi:hypothetical protein
MMDDTAFDSRMDIAPEFQHAVAKVLEDLEQLAHAAGDWHDPRACLVIRSVAALLETTLADPRTRPKS